MDKKSLQHLFSSASGFVYKFVGQVPADTDVSVYVTEQYVLSAPALATVVTEVDGQTVIYVDAAEEATVTGFELITDLVPDPEPVVVPVVAPEEPAPPEGQ